MRMEQRQLLTPRMIQSMEILQLPLMALEERIEQELQNNPVLEVREADGSEAPDSIPQIVGDDPVRQDRAEGEQQLVMKEDGAEDFDRLSRIADYLDSEEFGADGFGGRLRDRMGPGSSSFEGERDKKMDAMNNTASRSITLQEHLLGQWAFVETTPAVRAAGEAVINYINPDGYLKTDFETIQKESKTPLKTEDLHAAVKLIQTLEPSGIGARTVAECLLIQLDALENDADFADDHDFDLERALVRDHLKDLEMNRYPQISKKLGRPIEELQQAVKRLARLHPHPGKQVGGEDAPPITPDAKIYFDEETGKYEIEMANDPAPNLYISGMYRKMLKDRLNCDKKTREFLSNNIRNARWLIESIEQRKSTIHRVIRAVVDAQQEFFEKGPESLKPLPMISVADQLGIHVATVSRAVSEKWIQTPRGVYPLRKFFSGGTHSSDGEEMSWDAVKEKLRIIIDNEDKRDPLNDDEIVARLKDQGIDLARRTVAKYRKILDIPTARQRKQF